VKLKITDVEIMPDKDSKQFSWVSTFSGARTYECVHRCKDGSKVPVEVSSRLVHIDNRDVLQNLVRDLTRRKLAEKQERELLIERERVQLLSNFMTGASHQFKTPLSVIASRSYLLGKTDDPEQRKAHGEMINREVKSMAALIDSSVMLSTLTSLRHLDFASVDLIEVAREVVSGKTSSLQEKQLTVHTQAAQGAVEIPGHADYLFYALSHLLDNAIHYSHPDGDIWLRVGYSDAAAVIEVEDAGTGISDDDLPRIFETFFRGDKSGTTRGFGLGLPIVKMIVELHHGTLTVETEAGRGSRFRVLLPVHQQS
jgi:signal transduction histidine kinase